jgi:hypothetical protein
MSIDNYKNLLLKESIKELPVSFELEAGKSTQEKQPKISVFHSRITTLIESILKGESKSDQIKERLLNRLADLVFKEAKKQFKENPNVFVQPYVISSLSDKYKGSLRQRFEPLIAEEFKRLDPQNSTDPNIFLETRIKEKLNDKLFEKRNNQIYRLKSWCQYLFEVNTTLPNWYKYLALRSVVSFTDRDTKSQNRKRTNQTAEQFLPLDRQVLPSIYEQIQESGRETYKFFELYKNELTKMQKVNDQELTQLPSEEFLEGTWQTFASIKTENDFNKLNEQQKSSVEQLANVAKDSPWCLANPQTALSYLNIGQIRIYKVKNKPVLALNFKEYEDGSVDLAEARGSRSDEGLLPGLVEVMSQIYSQIEAEGITIDDEFSEQIAEEKQKNQDLKEKERLNYIIQEGVQNEKIDELNIKDIKDYFELYRKFVELDDFDDVQYYNNDQIHIFEQLFKRYSSEVLGTECPLQKALLPQVGYRQDQDYIIYDNDDSQELLNFREIKVAIRPVRLVEFEGYSSDMDSKRVLQEDEDGEEIEEEIHTYYSDNNSKEHGDYHQLEFANNLEIKNSDFSEYFKGDIYEKSKFGVVVFPKLKKVTNLKVSNSNIELPELLEIDELTIEENSKLYLPNIQKIGLLTFNQAFGSIRLPKQDKININYLRTWYSQFTEQKLLNHFDVEKIKSILLDFVSLSKSISDEFLTNLNLRSIDKRKVSFRSAETATQYSYNEIENYIFEQKAIKDFKNKLSLMNPEFSLQELSYVLEVEEPKDFYIQCSKEISDFRQNLFQIPIKLKKLTLEYYRNYENVVTKIKDVNSETQVIYDTDPKSNLNSDEYENLENLEIFKGGMITIFDNNSYLPNLTEIHSDLDLSYLSKAPNLSKLTKISGKVFINPDEKLVKQFAINLQSKLNFEIEEV